MKYQKYLWSDETYSFLKYNGPNDIVVSTPYDIGQALEMIKYKIISEPINIWLREGTYDMETVSLSCPIVVNSLSINYSPFHIPNTDVFITICPLNKARVLMKNMYVVNNTHIILKNVTYFYN